MRSEGFFDSVMRMVCALVNVILLAHPVRADEHHSADGGPVSWILNELHACNDRALKRSPCLGNTPQKQDRMWCPRQLIEAILPFLESNLPLRLIATQR